MGGSGNSTRGGGGSSGSGGNGGNTPSLGNFGNDKSVVDAVSKGKGEGDNKKTKGGMTEGEKRIDDAFKDFDRKNPSNEPSKPAKKDIYKSPETLAQEAKNREKKAELKAMSPTQRAEHFAKAKYIGKKSASHYKKTGQMPTAKEYSKWEKGYKDYKTKRDARTKADRIRMFGKAQAKLMAKALKAVDKMKQPKPIKAKAGKFSIKTENTSPYTKKGKK